MADTGVWAKCELDDEGKIVINIHAAAEWKAGETVTVGEDVTDKIPTEIMASLKDALNKVIAAGKVSMTSKAKSAAIEMANFKLGRKANNVINLDFNSSMKQVGSNV